MAPTIHITYVRGNSDTVILFGKCRCATDQDGNEWEPLFHESKQAFLWTLQWFGHYHGAKGLAAPTSVVTHTLSRSLNSD